jgi:hypothetical protein
MLSQRLNHFRVCSASDEIRSGHAQPTMKFVLRMLSTFSNNVFKMDYWFPLVSMSKLLKFHRTLSIGKICFANAQCAMKLFSHMLSVR